MTKHAAKYADTWNTGSWFLTYKERLEDIRSRNQIVDDICREIDRDLDSLCRSYLVYELDAIKSGLFEVYESEEVFRERIEKFIDIGITEFQLYWPLRDEQLPIFEKIAREVISELKEKYK